MKQKISKILLGIYDLFLSLGAIYTGIMMISGNGIFAEYPNEWASIVPFENWVIPGIIIIAVFGIGNIMGGQFEESFMSRDVRCQAVILKGRQILVIRHYNSKRNEEYWLLQGGVLEDGESEEECIIREIKEETNLDVEIKGILFDELGMGRDVYRRYITFLCEPLRYNENPGLRSVDYRKVVELVWCPII